MLSSFIWSRFVSGIKVPLGIFNLGGKQVKKQSVKTKCSCNFKVTYISFLFIVLFQKTQK